MLPFRRRTTVAICSLIALATFTLSAKDRPNVILILADDIGFEGLSCYGSASYHTPYLDRMADQGVQFQNAHVLPICTPTRVSLMTGKYNSRNWLAFGILEPNIRHIGHWMTDAGYRTCITGKWQLQSYNPPNFMPEWRDKGQRPEDAGFEDYFLWHTEHTEDKGSRYPDPRIQHNGKYLSNTEGKYGPDLFNNHALEFIEKHKDEPFFIYYPMALPHDPFQAPPHTEDWKVDRFKQDPKYYKDMVEYMDKMVGRVLNKLDELELRENTLVIFLGDNGTPPQVTSKLVDGTVIPGGKAHNNLRGTHVPFIISYPEAQKAGSKHEGLVDCNDVIPTIFEVCGIEPPAGEVFDGESLVEQIQGKPGTHRDWLFFHHDPLPGHGKNRFKLERWAIDRRWKVVESTGELFDIQADPEETTPIDPESSVAARVAYAKLTAVIDSFPTEYTPKPNRID
ncbi:sulfatase-like hydrolase/transferase [Pelagicoccus mobilis]|uniref:Sulfatase-like hydrolase/transferase n=1 Tax=Pelagicoccus mobilis TaxID=415221 RepID=A0A934S131_9BACT|nr:sulfatase-like hydrolase/transferase [Pelagicoccus mobilis]MBK1877509.1 sulfatase-like hydrolase/transferase [Pelagicoccus mobilis]